MNWNLLQPDETEFCTAYQVPHLLGRYLCACNLEADKLNELLHGDDVLSTSKADCIRQCAAELVQAKEKGWKVFIGGDYDTDGITATSIMKDTLDRLKIRNGYYIPDRFKEGYGLSAKTVELAHEKGYQLIITVDNGVKAQKAIQRAHELGIRIIITDHHETDGNTGADLLVHPTLMEEQFQYLSGAGVALELSRVLLGNVPMHTALAAIAAIADVMPLWKETRKIVKHGLQELRQGALPSVNALLYQGSPINPTTLSFQIIPKLNSVGRMNDLSNVNTLVPFLLSRDETLIAKYALQLNQVNNARKNLSSSMTSQAEQMISEEDCFELIYQPDFAEGICGLAAGRIANTYHKPAIVLSLSNGMIKGSGRSVPGFNLYEFFSEGFEDLLTAFGGHEMAVGLSLNEADYPIFKERVITKMSATGYVYEPPVQNAVLMKAEEMSLDEIAAMDILEPLPKELMEPVFAIEQPLIIKKFESPKVIKYTCQAARGSFDAVLYTRLNLEPAEQPDIMIGTLSVNRWRNNVTPQMEIKSLTR